MREKYPREITLLIDKSFSFSVQEKWKLKGEQRCSEPIVAGLAVIGSDRGPASCGLIWEFTGASCISLRHISLMNLNTARIRSFTHPSCVCRQLVEIATGIQRTHFCIIFFLYTISARCCNTEKRDAQYLKLLGPLSVLSLFLISTAVLRI